MAAGNIRKEDEEEEEEEEDYGVLPPEEMVASATSSAARISSRLSRLQSAMSSFFRRTRTVLPSSRCSSKIWQPDCWTSNEDERSSSTTPLRLDRAMTTITIMPLILCKHLCN
jgi:hypothetical protein